MRQLFDWNLLIEKRLHGCGNCMDVPPTVQRSSLPYGWLLVKRPNPTQAPNKVGPFIPGLKRPGLSGPSTVNRAFRTKIVQDTNAVYTTNLSVVWCSLGIQSP